MYKIAFLLCLSVVPSATFATLSFPGPVLTVPWSLASIWLIIQRKNNGEEMQSDWTDSPRVSKWTKQLPNVCPGKYYPIHRIFIPQSGPTHGPQRESNLFISSMLTFQSKQINHNVVLANSTVFPLSESFTLVHIIVPYVQLPPRLGNIQFLGTSEISNNKLGTGKLLNMNFPLLAVSVANCGWWYVGKRFITLINSILTDYSM